LGKKASTRNKSIRSVRTLLTRDSVRLSFILGAMQILFTGATSLAGREWCSQLAEMGHEVVAVSRRSLQGRRTIIADLCDPGCSEELPTAEFDVLVHFASYVPLRESASTWEECAPTNIDGTIRLLKWAEGRVGRIILASSCAVYGPKVYVPTDEEHPLRPDTQYAVTKYGQEQILQAFCLSRAVPLVMLRLGYVYGPGVPAERAIVQLLRKVMRSERIVLRNASSAGLHLIHTSDIALIGNHFLETAVGSYNVASPRHISLRDYVDAAMKVVGRETEVIEQNEPKTPPTNWYSIRKLEREAIGPRVSLQDGVASMIPDIEASAWGK
jgi:nucleoside-diphosphate-sugar epimerase